MKSRVRVLVLFAMLLANVATGAEIVSTPANFKAFGIAAMWENWDSVYQANPLILVSDADGATEFLIPGIDTLEAVSGGSFGTNDSYSLTLGFVPRDGYRVTSFRLMGRVDAEMERGIPQRDGAFNIRGGFAANNSMFGIGRPADVRIDDLHGTQTFDYTTNVLVDVGPWGPVAEFEIWGFVHANGAYTYYSYYDEAGHLQESKIGPTSNVTVSDVRFIVYWEVVPVPEPATWTMLLSGLLALAAMRRRAGWDRPLPQRGGISRSAL